MTLNLEFVKDVYRAETIGKTTVLRLTKILLNDIEKFTNHLVLYSFGIIYINFLLESQCNSY